MILEMLKSDFRSHLSKIPNFSNQFESSTMESPFVYNIRRQFLSVAKVNISV